MKMKINNPTEKIFGFPVKLDWTLAWMFGVYIFLYRDNFKEMNYALTYLTLIYFCVLLHEFGHVYAAKMLGYPCKQIKMYMVGGIAQIEGDWEKKPKHEFLITIAGPFVNLIIAISIGFFYVSDISSLNEILNSEEKSWIRLLPDLAVANLILIVFNMLPIFPLDGGRVFRSILVMITNKHEKSTLFVNYSALILSIALGVFMTYISQYVTVVICVLIFVSNLFQIFETYKDRKDKKLKKEREEKQREEMLKNLPSHITLLFQDENFLCTYEGSFENDIPEEAEMLYEKEDFGKSFRYPNGINSNPLTREEILEFLSNLGYVQNGKIDKILLNSNLSAPKMMNYSHILLSRTNI